MFKPVSIPEVNGQGILKRTQREVLTTRKYKSNPKNILPEISKSPSPRKDAGFLENFIPKSNRYVDSIKKPSPPLF